MDSDEVDKDAHRLRAIGTLLIAFGFAFVVLTVIVWIVVLTKLDSITDESWDARDGMLLLIQLVASLVSPLVLLGIGYLCRFTGRKHLMPVATRGRELSGTT